MSRLLNRHLLLRLTIIHSETTITQDVALSISFRHSLTPYVALSLAIHTTAHHSVDQSWQLALLRLSAGRAWKEGSGRLVDKGGILSAYVFIVTIVFCLCLFCRLLLFCSLSPVFSVFGSRSLFFYLSYIQSIASQSASVPGIRCAITLLQRRRTPIISSSALIAPQPPLHPQSSASSIRVDPRCPLPRGPGTYLHPQKEI